MAERYPGGMHGAIATGITELLGDSVAVTVATQDQPEHGLAEEALDATDVVTWWGHPTHASVDGSARHVDQLCATLLERVRRKTVTARAQTAHVYRSKTKINKTPVKRASLDESTKQASRAS